MKIEETTDGTIRVIALDPAKHYWFVVSSRDLARRLMQGPMQNGQILIKPPDVDLVLLEHDDRTNMSVHG